MQHPSCNGSVPRITLDPARRTLPTSASFRIRGFRAEALNKAPKKLHKQLKNQRALRLDYTLFLGIRRTSIE